MASSIFWDPNRTAFTIPFIERPIAWYGILFALGFFIGFYLMMFLFKADAKTRTDWPEAVLKKKARLFSERLTVYVIVSTVIGARLGHLVFYEQWSHYLSHPAAIIKTWEGGLASHGGVIGILIGLIFFYARSRNQFPGLSMRRIIDLLVVPSLFVATLIRLGNFMNQEVLGVPTSVPWAIVFGHPIDGSVPAARHPAQLYEALFYFVSCLVFWKVFSKALNPKKTAADGRLAGLFFVTTFSFRFLIEYLKEEQSHLIGGHWLTMGQWLSIPLIVFGLLLLSVPKRRPHNHATSTCR